MAFSENLNINKCWKKPIFICINALRDDFSFSVLRCCGRCHKYNVWPPSGYRSSLYILIQFIKTYFRYLGLSILFCEKKFQIAACINKEKSSIAFTKLWRFFFPFQSLGRRHKYNAWPPSGCRGRQFFTLRPPSTSRSSGLWFFQ